MRQKTSQLNDTELPEEWQGHASVASIYFETDNAVLDAQDKSVILMASRAIDMARQMRPAMGCTAELRVYGHADFRGSLDHNKALGLSRADAVRRELKARFRNKVYAVSRGERSAQQPGNLRRISRELLAEDRRVDIVLTMLKSNVADRKQELRNLKEELSRLNKLLQNNKDYEVTNRVGPLTLVTPGSHQQNGYRDAVKGLEDFSTIGKSTSESLLEVGKLLVTEVPIAFGKIIWTAYLAPSRDLAASTRQLLETATGTTPSGARMSSQEVAKVKQTMRRIEKTLDEATKCDLKLVESNGASP